MAQECADALIWFIREAKKLGTAQSGLPQLKRQLVVRRQKNLGSCSRGNSLFDIVSSSFVLLFSTVPKFSNFAPVVVDFSFKPTFSSIVTLLLT